MSHHSNTPIEPIWSAFKCEKNSCYRWQAGPLKIWVKRMGQDWLIASEQRPEDLLITLPWSLLKEEPPNLPWQRWSFNHIHDQIEISPCMPDRPLVVKTRVPTNLPPGVHATFYVSIPLWVSCQISSEGKTTEISRFNSLTLSNTWFGNLREGEFCYALKTRAVRSQSEATVMPHRALCPVVIHNKAEKALPIQKICLRAKQLNIYQSENQLWTNKIDVTFKGDGLSSKVQYSDEPSSEVVAPKLLRPAEEKPKNNFLDTLEQSFADLF